MRVRSTLAALCLLLGLFSSAHAARHRGGITDPCLRHRGCRYHVQNATIFSRAELEAYALNEYQAAYSLRKTPWLLFNIARILHRLNRLSEAIPYYQKYLDERASSDDEQSTKAQKFLSEAKQEIAQSSRLRLQPMMSLPVVTAPMPERKIDTPIYKKPWLWISVGIASAVIAVGVTGGVMAATRSSGDQVPPGWPVFRPFQ